MQISCSDYSFPLLPRAQRLALLNLLGFEFVDLGLFARNSGLRPQSLAANPKDFIKQLRFELRRTDMRVSDVFLQIGLEPAIAAVNNPDPAVQRRNRKLFHLAIEVCSAFECHHLTGLPGVRHSRVPKRDDLARAHEATAWRQREASQAGIEYAIEPHIGSLCSNVSSTCAFLEAVPGLTLTLDYGHFIASGTPSNEVHRLLPFASHIHARGASPRRLQVAMEDNTIDFEGMIQRLRMQKYEGWMAVEYVWTKWQQCDANDNISETILLQRHLRQLIKKPQQRLQPKGGIAHV